MYIHIPIYMYIHIYIHMSRAAGSEVRFEAQARVKFVVGFRSRSYLVAYEVAASGFACATQSVTETTSHDGLLKTQKNFAFYGERRHEALSFEDELHLRQEQLGRRHEEEPSRLLAVHDSSELEDFDVPEPESYSTPCNAGPCGSFAHTSGESGKHLTQCIGIQEQKPGLFSCPPWAEDCALSAEAAAWPLFGLGKFRVYSSGLIRVYGRKISG